MWVCVCLFEVGFCLFVYVRVCVCFGFGFAFFFFSFEFFSLNSWRFFYFSLERDYRFGPNHLQVLLIPVTVDGKDTRPNPVKYVSSAPLFQV